MRTRSLILLVLLVTLTGCIVRYQGFPGTTLESLQKDHNLSALPATPGFEQCNLQPSPFGVGARLAVDFIDGLNLLNPLYWLMYPEHPERPDSLSARLQGVQVPVQGGQLVFTSRPNHTEVSPQERLACVARIAVKDKLTFAEKVNVFVSGITLSIIPAYTPNAVVYSVTFSVFKEQRLSQEYQYNFSKGGVAGVLVLPFAWISLFTSSEKEAFQAIFQQFLFDLQRDH